MNKGHVPRGTEGQAEVIAFLGRADSYGPDMPRVERIETHGALVFLAGDEVYKIKRAVRFAYMDFSTLELRRRACAREVEINQPQAPELYRGLVAVTRAADGSLVLGGDGDVVEWAVHMRRFPDDALLSHIAAARGLEPTLARDMADAVFDYHRAAPADRTCRAGAQMQAIIEEIDEALRAAGPMVDAVAVRRLAASADNRRATARDLLADRARNGFVRRCHGDLHLNNIVLWQGRPTLFDALEFDETLATIDTFYDLAFLLMDLDRHDQRHAANIVLNRYLWRSQQISDIQALALLPLFLALRAGIRAMVATQRAAQLDAGQLAGLRAQATSYLEAATGYVSPPPPRLIAIGGVSGTGKSTLATGLAPRLGAAPGAFHLRSDLERKAMFGVGETERLPAAGYAPDVTHRVYDLLLAKARIALAAGHAVVVDAAHLQPAEKQAIEQVADALSVPFKGLWLTAPDVILHDRVVRRRGDASDATAEILRQQLSWFPTAGRWSIIDASGTPAEALAAAAAEIGVTR